MKAAILAIGLVALLLGSTQLAAHSWYDPWCCNERDCQPYPHENVTVTDAGYLLHDGMLVPFDEARTSQDGDYHRCVLAGQHRCFYAPPVGM